MIRFRLRIRNSDQINDGRKQLRASIIFAHLQPGQTQTLSGRRLVWSRLVYVSALRLNNGELRKLGEVSLMITIVTKARIFF